MIEIKNLCKTFQTADGTVEALKNINLKINDGDIYGIIGMSGAGKSTLVRCINMLERPTSGTVVIDGKDMAALSAKELRQERRNITMIFQQFNLLMQRNCLKNVCFPMELEGVKKSQAKKKAMELLETVGLPDKAMSYPAQLSGGQQQRVAIARALATNPKVLLCDEATSALDPNTTHAILELIKDINKKLGITVIVITHQMSVVEEICNNVAILDGGVVVEEGETTQIFSNPQSDAAKRLVYPGGEEEPVSASDGEKIIRIVFNGSSNTETPLIAHMATEYGIMANILSASTKTIGSHAFGSMMIGVPEGSQYEKALEFLKTCDGITAEEVQQDA
ncbi:MAG: methionine ABC transporter ATP-binding protein [Acutalibacteraceae bacterium]